MVKMFFELGGLVKETSCREVGNLHYEVMPWVYWKINQPESSLIIPTCGSFVTEVNAVSVAAI